MREVTENFPASNLLRSLPASPKLLSQHFFKNFKNTISQVTARYYKDEQFTKPAVFVCICRAGGCNRHTILGPQTSFILALIRRFVQHCKPAVKKTKFVELHRLKILLQNDNESN